MTGAELAGVDAGAERDRTLVSRVAIAVAVVVGLAATAVPIVAVARLPLHDYPNHLTRMHLIARWSELPALHRFYEIGWFVVPNIGMDVIVVLLAHVVSIDVAARLFTFMTLALCFTGTVALAHTIQGRHSVWPYLAALFVYNGILMWGFLNYLFGVGVMLWALAIWIRLRDRRPLLAVVTGALFALVLFFAHLVAFGLYGLVVVGLELDGAWRRQPRARALRQLAFAALPFVVPAAIFLLGSDTVRGGSIDVHTHTLLEKLAMVPAVLSIASPALDVFTATVLVALLVWMLGRGVRFHLAPRMRIAAVLLVVAYLLLPYGIFGTWYLDVRLPVAFVFLALAAVDVRRASPRVVAVAAVTASLLLAVRTVQITREWQAFERRQDAIVAGLDGVPEGATLFTTYVSRDGTFAEKLARWRPPLFFVAAYVMITHEVFVVPIFADPRHQPIALKPAYADEHWYQAVLIDTPPTPEGLPGVVRELRRLHFGPEAPPPSPLYLLLLDDDIDAAMPPAATLVGHGAGFTLYAIAAPSA